MSGEVGQSLRLGALINRDRRSGSHQSRVGASPLACRKRIKPAIKDNYNCSAVYFDEEVSAQVTSSDSDRMCSEGVTSRLAFSWLEAEALW
jgi:hypothetical protein